MKDVKISVVKSKITVTSDRVGKIIIPWGDIEHTALLIHDTGDRVNNISLFHELSYRYDLKKDSRIWHEMLRTRPFTKILKLHQWDVKSKMM
jgi:hypothetical protein